VAKSLPLAKPAAQHTLAYVSIRQHTLTHIHKRTPSRLPSPSRIYFHPLQPLQPLPPSLPRHSRY
jgi:hypothetical protein